MDSPEFTLSQVANAAGIDVGTLRSWLQRKHWRLDMAVGDSPADVAGKAHLVTLRRALQIGAAAELVRNGVEPSRAFKAAWYFSDAADPLEAEGYIRAPGELFRDGSTILIAYKDRDIGVVMRLDDNASWQNLVFNPFVRERQISGSFVWLNFVDKRIRSALLEGSCV